MSPYDFPCAYRSRSLLIAGRHPEVLPCAERLVPTLAEAGLTLTAMRAWTWVGARARPRCVSPPVTLSRGTTRAAVVTA